MFVPIRDHPNFKGFPLVNWLLIGVNVAVYLVFSLPLSSQLPDPQDPMTAEYVQILARLLGLPPLEVLQHVSAYDIFIYVHGYRPADSSVESLFTSMFLHAGFAHLAGNMLFLWIYGDNVEHRLGRVGYLMAYLGTGACATWTHSVFSQEPWLPVVGASGAISGVLGLYFVWFPRNVVKIFVALFPFFMDVVLLPARWVLGIYLVVDNLLPFIFQGGSGGISHGAHIGGFVGGLGLALVLRQWSDEPGPAPKGAATQARQYIANNPNGPDLAESHLKLGLWHLQNGQPTTAYQYLLSALDLNPTAEVARQARIGLAAIEELARRKRQR